MSAAAAARRATVGIWLDVGSLGNRTGVSTNHLASNLRQLGASFGRLSQTILYEDCIANRTPSDRSFRSDLGSLGVEVLHYRPSTGGEAAEPNEALQWDVWRFLEEHQDEPTALVVGTTDRLLAPFLKTLPPTRADRQIIVLASESLRSSYFLPLRLAPIDNLLRQSSPIGASVDRPVLDVEALFNERHEDSPKKPPAAMKFDLGEFFPVKKA